MLIHQIDAALTTFGRSPCIESEDDVPVSGHTLAADIGRGTSALLSLGVVQGDRIVIACEKSLAVVALALAGLRTGAILTPLPSDIRQPHLEAVIDDAQPTIVVASAKQLPRLAAKLRMSRVRTILTLEGDGSGTWRDLCATQQPARTSVFVRPSDVALLSYDLTEVPRAAMFTHAALSRQVELARQMLGLERGETLSHGLIEWGTPPALAGLLAAWLSHARVRWRNGGDDRAVDVVLAQEFAPGRARAFGPLTDHSDTRAEGYLALTEAGIVALRRHGEGLILLPGLKAEIEGETLVLSDKAIFSGYWRRAAESEQVLKAGGFATALPARSDAGGRIAIGPQP